MLSTPFKTLIIATGLLLSGLSLTGCATNGSSGIRQVIVANSQFDCKPEPDPTKVDTSSDIAISLYISRLEDTGRSCRDQLKRVKDALQVQGVEITDVMVLGQKNNASKEP